MRIPVLATAFALVLSSQLSASPGDCPSAVTAAALKAHAGATVASCKKEVEKGRTQFEVKLATKDGQKVELDVSPDGNILLTEEVAAVGDVPQVVMTAFNAKYARAKPTRAEKQTGADGKVTYELAFPDDTKKQKKKEATFTIEGIFVEEE